MRQRRRLSRAKVIFTTAWLLVAAFSLNAQNGKVVAAWKYLQDYENVRDTNSLHNAKEAIDLATENEITRNKAKTWVYRGKIYKELFELRYQAEYNRFKNMGDVNDRTLAAYFNSNLNDLVRASEAFLKARELDTKKDYSEDINSGIDVCGKHLENIALAYYRQKDYANALKGFEKAMEINSHEGKPDTSDLMNARITAELSQNNVDEKMLFDKMLAFKVGKANAYHNYQIFLIEKMNDAAGALDVIKTGRSLYPDDVSLIKDETNFYLKSGSEEDVKKAINNLMLALEKSPNDPIVNLALGNLYDRLANPVGKDGKGLTSPANYEELIVNAEKYYKMAYELNKTDATTLFDLGALYNNKAKIMLDKADDIKDEKKYKLAVKNANDVLELAKPYLEEAYQQNGKDCDVIRALKRMYISSNETDKMNNMVVKAKALGCD
jgi:tetratricopeptide (TPR) repeat protein